MKPSGICWIGTVPDHWRVQRFKHSVNSCRNGLWGGDPVDAEGVECVRVADFDRRSLTVIADVPTKRGIPESQLTGHALTRGDLLLEKSGGGERQPVGQVVLYNRDEQAVCSNFIARMTIAEAMEPRFWNYQHHAAYSARINTRSVKQTSGIQNLDSSQYLNELAAFPPHDEQVGIANHLDRATARIDALMDRKAHFIALLREKRQALITHAVTKGLDDDVPMKDSGVEWLGEVPIRWKMARFKHAGNFQTGMDYKHLAEGDVPVFGSSEQPFDHVSVPMASGPAIAIGRKGTIDKPYLLTGAFWAVDTCMFNVVCSPTFGVEFCYYVAIIVPWIDYSTKTALPSLTQEQVDNVPLPRPPYDEQLRIAAYLNGAVARIDTLITQTERSIALLHEKRTALITAAVTGKIDLRAHTQGVAA